MAALPPATLDRLRAYADLLRTWTQRINLVSRADAQDPDHLWHRHIEDSLRLLPHMPPDASRAIDLGSGAGLPGLVLAIASGRPVDLVESDLRKAAFLREAIRLTMAPARVHDVRIEACGLSPAPLVTARALAPLPKLLQLAAPLLAARGTLLLLKGVRAGDEVMAARETWSFSLETHGTPASPILAITGLAAYA